MLCFIIAVVISQDGHEKREDYSVSLRKKKKEQLVNQRRCKLATKTKLDFYSQS